MTAINHILNGNLGWRPRRRRPPIRLTRAKKAWLVWAVSAIFVQFQFFLQLTSGEMVSGLMKSFHLTAFYGGLLASSYYFIYVLLQSPAGLMIDRFGPRRLLTAGAVVVALGCWSFSISDSFAWALCGRLLMGSGAAFAFVGCLNLIAGWFPARRFGLMTSMAEVFGMVGSIVGGLFLALIIVHYGWRSAMSLAAVISAGLALLLWFIIRDRPDNVTSIQHRTFRQFIPDIKGLLRKPEVWLNAIYSGLMFGVITVFVALWAVPFIEQAYHVSLIMSTAICDMTFVGAAIGCPVLGYLDAAFNCRRLLLMGLPLVAAVLMGVIIYFPALPLGWLYTMFLLLGVTVSTYMLTFVIGNQLATPQTQGASIGFVNMFSVGTAPLLQPLIGYFLDKLSAGSGAHATTQFSVWSFQWALSIMVVALLCAAVLGYFLPAKTNVSAEVATAAQ